MKKQIPIVLFILTITSNLFAQPGQIITDMNGFNISANNIKTKNDSTLYLADYIYISEYMPMSAAILTNKYKYDSTGLNFNVFADEYYRTKDVYQYKMFCIVYNEEVMILKIKKNRTHFSVTILNLIFQEGIFELDLEKMYQKYGEDDYPYGIWLPMFPIEE